VRLLPAILKTSNYETDRLVQQTKDQNGVRLSCTIPVSPVDAARNKFLDSFGSAKVKFEKSPKQ